MTRLWAAAGALAAAMAMGGLAAAATPRLAGDAPGVGATPINLANPAAMRTARPYDPTLLDTPVKSLSVACSTTTAGHSSTLEREVLDERLLCTVVMTDARTSGEMTADVTITFSPATSTAGSWKGEFAVRNAYGAWIGSGSGAAARDLGTATPASLWGKVIYHGSGSLDGLVYTELLAEEPTSSAISGWVGGHRGPYERVAAAER